MYQQRRRVTDRSDRVHGKSQTRISKGFAALVGRCTAEQGATTHGALPYIHFRRTAGSCEATQARDRVCDADAIDA
jgi:hypothetical protein